MIHAIVGTLAAGLVFGGLVVGAMLLAEPYLKRRGR
jgi:hypothetical protein